MIIKYRYDENYLPIFSCNFSLKNSSPGSLVIIATANKWMGIQQRDRFQALKSRYFSPPPLKCGSTWARISQRQTYSQDCSGAIFQPDWKKKCYNPKQHINDPAFLSSRWMKDRKIQRVGCHTLRVWCHTLPQPGTWSSEGGHEMSRFGDSW